MTTKQKALTYFAAHPPTGNWAQHHRNFEDAHPGVELSYKAFKNWAHSWLSSGYIRPPGHPAGHHRANFWPVRAVVKKAQNDGIPMIKADIDDLVC